MRLSVTYLRVTVIASVGCNELFSKDTKLMAKFLIAERDTSFGHWTPNRCATQKRGNVDYPILGLLVLKKSRIGPII